MKIENCTFNGVNFDEKSNDVLLEVAKGLNNLTKIYLGGGVHIDAMLRIETQEIKKPVKKKKK